MSDTIFADQQPAEPEVKEAPKAPEQKAEAPADPYNDLLKGIQTDDGRVKYATVSDALSAIPHQNKHISTIENENAELRAKLEQFQKDLEKAQSLDSIVEKLNRKKEDGDPAPTGITEQDVLAILNKKESESKMKANAVEVVQRLRSEYGDKAEEVFYKKADELSVPREFLDDIARKSPKAALELFKLERQTVHKTTGSSTSSLDQGEKPKPKSIAGLHSHKQIREVWDSHKPQ